MRRLAILALVACKGSGHRAEARVDKAAGSGFTAEPGAHDPDYELPFTITHVYEHQQPASAPPFHGPGGTWTYFDAHLTADPAATFGIGLPAFEKRGGDGIGGFGTMWLVPTTSDAGARFVKAFATKFHVEVPAGTPGALAPMQVELAILGHDVSSGEVGYSGTGTWDATKCFFSSDDVDAAELFFNVSMSEKRGVWAEKDADYDADVARVLAIALRDGVPPPRTPANDPTLMATAPRLELGRPIASHRAMVIGRSPARVVLADTLEDHSVLLALDPKTGATTELYRTRDRLSEGVCDEAAAHCLISETHGGRDRFTFSSDDPSRIVVLDGASATPLAVPGVGKSPSPHAISPDGRYAVINGELAATVIYDRKTKHATAPEQSHSFRDVIGWRGPAAALVEITSFDESDAKSYGVWHLDTNKLEPLAEAPAERTAATSPDGSRTVEIRNDGTIVVTPKGGAARSFVLDARDRRFAEPGCCAWLDNRYLAFPAKHFGVIDTDAMKIGFVADPGERRIEPLPGVAAAIVTDEDNAYFAKIVL
jgi:hypothetical protein